MMHDHRRMRLVQDDRDREAAADVVRRVFDGVPGKRLGTDRTSISRAQNGSDCNPLFRLRRWARRARANGVPRERAELLAVDVRMAIEAAYGPIEMDYREALRIEQAADADEDGIELDAYEDAARLPEWIERAKVFRAALDVAIAAAELEVLRQVAEAA